jgi:hypothetical protein
MQIPNEKSPENNGQYPEFIITNKRSYKTKIIRRRIGAGNIFAIDGLMQYVEDHKSYQKKKPNSTAK